MTKNTYFRFKQFQLDQSLCAMKVTTDAILFGALVNVEGCESILDIGSGTGLLSLMVAQRTSAQITAVELDPSAAQQSRLNIDNSPWASQITQIHNSIQNFVQTNPARFDCVITNPPFFQQALKGPDQQRNMARHTDSLSFDDLILAITSCLSLSGTAWLLLPVESARFFLKQAKGRLYLQQVIEVSSTRHHPPHRWVMALRHQPEESHITKLNIYTHPPEYTNEFKRWTQPYYLSL